VTGVDCCEGSACGCGHGFRNGSTFYGDDGARVRMRAIARMGASVDLGFGLDNAVNSISPNIREVRTRYYLMRFNTFGNLVAAIRDESH